MFVAVIFALVVGGCNLLENNQETQIGISPQGTHTIIPYNAAISEQRITSTPGSDSSIITVESPTTPPSNLEQEPSRIPSFPGEIWRFEFPRSVVTDFYLAADGAAYVLLEDNSLFILNPDGSLRGKFTLPRDPFIIPSSDFQIEEPISPVGLPDGTILMVAIDLTVLALSPMGDIIWEAQLSSEPYVPPSVQGGYYYLQDKEAGVHIFDANGLVWEKKSGAAPLTAAELTISSDGSVYFPVTNYSENFLQAFGLDSRDLWVVRLERDQFYKKASVSSDGQFLSLGNSLMFAESGEKINTQLPVEVDEFAFGKDGFLYGLTGQNVIQLEDVGNQINLAKEINWLNGTNIDKHPGSLQVDANGVIWIEFGDFLNKQLIWIDQNGEVIRSFNAGESFGFYGDPDYNGSRLLLCITAQDFGTKICGLYSALEGEALWEENESSVPGFTYSHTLGEFIYLLTWDGFLRKISLF